MAGLGGNIKIGKFKLPTWALLVGGGGLAAVLLFKLNSGSQPSAPLTSGITTGAANIGAYPIAAGNNSGTGGLGSAINSNGSATSNNNTPPAPVSNNIAALDSAYASARQQLYNASGKMQYWATATNDAIKAALINQPWLMQGQAARSLIISS